MVFISAARLIIDYSHQGQSSVRRALDLAFDVVALAEEREPIVEHLLVLVGQVGPIGSALFGLERRLSQSARCVLAGKDWEEY